MFRERVGALDGKDFFGYGFYEPEKTVRRSFWVPSFLVRLLSGGGAIVFFTKRTLEANGAIPLPDFFTFVSAYRAQVFIARIAADSFLRDFYLITLWSGELALLVGYGGILFLVQRWLAGPASLIIWAPIMAALADLLENVAMTIALCQGASGTTLEAFVLFNTCKVYLISAILVFLLPGEIVCQALIPALRRESHPA